MFYEIDPAAILSNLKIVLLVYLIVTFSKFFPLILFSLDLLLFFPLYRVSCVSCIKVGKVYNFGQLVSVQYNIGGGLAGFGPKG